jgi:signal transduction histidine kinase
MVAIGQVACLYWGPVSGMLAATDLLAGKGEDVSIRQLDDGESLRTFVAPWTEILSGRGAGHPQESVTEGIASYLAFSQCALELSSAGVLFFGADRQVMACNVAALRLLGLDPPEDRDAARNESGLATPVAAMSRCMASLLTQVLSGQCVPRGSFRLEAGPRAGMEVIAAGAPVRNADHTLAGAVLVVEAAEAPGCQAAPFFSAQPYRASAIGAWRADGAGRIHYVSPDFLELLGQPLGSLQEHSWSAWVHPDHRARVEQAWRACVASGGDWEEEFDVLDATDTRRTIVSRATPMRDDTGALVEWVGVHLDDTAGRRVREELQDLAATLEQRVQLRTALSEDRARQLRSMAIALTHAEQRERRRLAIELHDYLAQLLVASKLKAGQLDDHVDGRAQALIRELREMLNEALRYTRTLVAELSPTILYEAGLFAAVKWLGAQMAQHGLKVEVEMRGPAITLGEDQAVLVFQTVRELLFNVVRHAEVDTAEVRLHHVPGASLEVRVTDRGVGFDAGAKTSGKKKLSFGLLNVRERVEALGGEFSLESTPGQGTCATFVVPLEAQEPESAPVAPKSEKQAPSDRPSVSERLVRVLLVDDHALVRQGLRSLIECCEDIEVVGEAANGVEGVRLAGELQPDVVVMDVQMPQMNGIEATRRIHQEYDSIRIVGLSVNDDAQVAESMRQAGAVDFLTKGGPSDELYRALRGVAVTP